MTSAALEAKIVVLGSQNVGKTSLVHRYMKNQFIPSDKARSTVGASFFTTRVHDPESGATIRLQIWDTAGQERFRSISRLYYRGAHAAILCYDVTNKASFENMGVWIEELKEYCGAEVGDMIVHVVGTKSDVVVADPKSREVPFERCIGYIAEHFYPETATTGPAPLMAVGSPPSSHTQIGNPPLLASPTSNRSSGFWGSEVVWDCCHEVSSKDGEGVEEVFRVITRKLVEQHSRRVEHQRMVEENATRGRTPAIEGGAGAAGYFDLPNGGNGSFRIGIGDKRRSWLGFPATPGGFTSVGGEEDEIDEETVRGLRRKRCC
nr:ras-like gtp-binding protein ryl2 [Quercus suber]